jgi:hypothetical protein
MWNPPAVSGMFQRAAKQIRTKQVIMRVHVERDAGDADVEKLKCFRLDGRRIEVVENLDRWFGPDHAYFKVRGDDGNLYILRLDEARDAWELTMFRSSYADTFAALPALRRLNGDGKG